MNVEEQVRLAVDEIDVEPRDVRTVVADGQRLRQRRRAVTAVAGAVAAMVVVAVTVGVLGGSDDRAVPPSSFPSDPPPSSAGIDAEAGSEGLEVIPAGQRDAPVELSGTSVDGTDLDVADLRGNVVLIRLWGSWCAPCLEDVAMLDSLDEQPLVEVMGVAIDETPREHVRVAEEQLGLDFESIYNPGEETLRMLKGGPHVAVPSTIVLDRAGRVAAVAVGQVTGSGLQRVVMDLARGSDDSALPHPTWPLPTLLLIRNSTPDPIWIVFDNGSKWHVKPGREIKLGSKEVCSQMPLTATTLDGDVLGAFDEPCDGQTWNVTSEDGSSRGHARSMGARPLVHPPGEWLTPAVETSRLDPTPG